jgi:hypothetical protein
VMFLSMEIMYTKVVWSSSGEVCLARPHYTVECKDSSMA